MRNVRLLVTGVAVALAIMIAGCAQGPIQGSPEALAQTEQQAVGYKLDAGDKVHITVFGEDNLSGDYQITPSGQIALPLAGNIQAAGLTVPELQAAVTQKLGSGYVREPRVTVEAADLGPYYVLGEVNKPGKYAYTPNLTVLAAVATAEGFTYRADSTRVFIKHMRDSSEREYPLTATTAVQPGDTIRVTERYF